MSKACKEIELKFRLQPQAVEELATCGLVGTFGIGPEKRQRLVSTYFDTPRHALRRSAAALRIRDHGKGREQTLKVPVEGPAGLQNFAEWTVAIDGETPDLDLIGDPEVRDRFTARGYGKRLRPVFTTEVERRTRRLKTDGVEAELAIDQGAIRGRRRDGRKVSEPICEAELELLSGDPAAMLDIAVQLNELTGLRLGHRTKPQRGYALVQPSLRPTPRKAARVPLDVEMTTGEAFQAIAASALDHLFDNEEPVLRGEPEGIHQARVAIRRLRSAMRAFKRALPYEGRKAFSGEFGWVQQRMGPARDWHVFLHETLPLVATGREGDTGLGRLRRIARDARRRTGREAAEVLGGKRYTRLILRFEHWLAGLSGSQPDDGFEQPLVPFAGKVLDKTYRDLEPRHRTLSRMPSAELHAMRIAGKEARYAADFLQSLYPHPETGRYLELLSVIQDRLGEINDAGVARRILTTLKAGRIDPGTERIIGQWSERRVVECARAAQPHWRRFVNATPFWKIHEAAVAAG